MPASLAQRAGDTPTPPGPEPWRPPHPGSPPAFDTAPDPERRLNEQALNSAQPRQVNSSPGHPCTPSGAQV